MLSEAKALQLITIYYYVCQQWEEQLQYSVQRFTHNDQPLFTDAEVITLYLFVMQTEQRFTIRQIYDFAKNYLPSWFPLLPSYQAFNHRLNRLSEAFRLLAGQVVAQFRPPDCSTHISLLDSMPVITCSGKRKAKVARQIVDKGYCSTKSMYYYGLKLHLLGWQRPGTLPYVEYITLTGASENDLNVLRQDWGTLAERSFIGDKIYRDKEWQQQLQQHFHSEVLTPVKGVKNKPELLIQRDKAADDLFSSVVSAIRQPIESLFNWLIEKTGLQKAAKVRSQKGLLVFVFARIAAAYISLTF